MEEKIIYDIKCIERDIKYHLVHVGNMDESPVWFDVMTPKSYVELNPTAKVSLHCNLYLHALLIEGGDKAVTGLLTHSRCCVVSIGLLNCLDILLDI